MKPGWRTSEFWLTLLISVPAILVSLGLVPGKDREYLSSETSKVVNGLVAAVALWSYIRSRGTVKAAASNGSPARLVLLPVLLFLAAGTAGAREPACLFGKAHDTSAITRILEQQTRTLERIADTQAQILAILQQQRQPQQLQPQIIVWQPPLQQIPIGELPRQQIPLGEAPRQQIPLGEQPRQQLPLGEQPRQLIPPGTAPRQDIPLEQRRTPPAGTLGPQRYQPALAGWRAKPAY